MSHRRPLVIACLLILTLATFAPAISCGFINYDDDLYVTQNPHVRGRLTWENIHYELTHQQEMLYHPLSILNLTVDHAFFKLHAGGYHAENVVIHSLSVVLLFLILADLTGEIARPTIATALWAVHPLRVESVVWIAERKDVLSMFFALAALWTYVRMARNETAPARQHDLPNADKPASKSTLPRTLAYQFLMLLFLSLSLLAKPSFFSLPLLMLLLDFWPLRRFARIPAGRLVAEKTPLLLLGFIWVTWIVHTGDPAPGAVQPLFELPDTRAMALNAIVAYVRYLVHHVALSRLATPYPIHHDGWPTWQLVGCAILLIAITALCLTQIRKRPWLAVGWLWYCVALLPMSGIKIIGDYAMTDRYSYLPSIGLMIMLIWSIPDHWLGDPERRSGSRPADATQTQGRALALASIVVIVTLVIFTQRQIGYWHDTVSLFSHTITVEDGTLAEINLGAMFARQGDYDAAIECDERSIAMYPKYALAWNNLGWAWTAKQDQQKANYCFQKAIEYYPQMSDPHRGLGAALEALGQLPAAEKELQRALTLDPYNPENHFQMGLYYADGGINQMQNAADEFQQAIKYDPRNPSYEHNLGVALTALGKKAEAKIHLDRARALFAAKPPSNS